MLVVDLEAAFGLLPQSALHVHLGECAVRNAAKRWLAGVEVIIGRVLAVVVGDDVDDCDVDGGDEDDMSAKVGFELLVGFVRIGG